MAAAAAAAAAAPPAPSWEALALAPWLVRQCRALGMRAPTEVQASCLPPALKGGDVIGCAPTGSGKTAAFALPVLSELSRDPFGIFALVVTPTRCGPRAPRAASGSRAAAHSGRAAGPQGASVPDRGAVHRVRRAHQRALRGGGRRRRCAPPRAPRYPGARALTASALRQT